MQVKQRSGRSRTYADVPAVLDNHFGRAVFKIGARAVGLGVEFDAARHVACARRAVDGHFDVGGVAVGGAAIALHLQLEQAVVVRNDGLGGRGAARARRPENRVEGAVCARALDRHRRLAVAFDLQNFAVIVGGVLFEVQQGTGRACPDADIA